MFQEGEHDKICQMLKVSKVKWGFNWPIELVAWMSLITLTGVNLMEWYGWKPI